MCVWILYLGEEVVEKWIRLTFAWRFVERFVKRGVESFVQGFVIGPLTDVIGRKPPVIIGFLVAGTALILIPYFKVIWPWFFILRSTVYCGCMIGLNLPLLPDYVAP